ncbi:bifunctional tRNA (5-methylaminomethyl-2-thiouridine)(34)-methyltransferase MnmD/FAD-dependent 5-carboxymethylaminomethyl-2-thiouridine(34) oxidoreductase MnmC [Pseudomonas sp. FME51]|uniref:bifunctional tRNA (5-methylaminomethyl-2-thiouridine)(34)-methyltransferase MnmD/FAD-dependent 5-carboxymethylaminomethyl-2-thiouridine(34) oxidoreductase MnmC n=1 Tax=Pseudomonas sp. FME51 TaxID=2742609 RepID=UPI001866CBCA|nr:bifunctional tRNA (5-methylaminomethyl-2-thiouridine)(34)-methyltransferase MnmD/FAD-dependent 5-carboxymethylaminomethyl-2-thiouridine(34) oxidoreductase MnmC [Pseudomonas sp. FME51]
MKSSPSFAELSWSDDGQPFSTHFGDVYFSRESGLEETRHVFLHHNKLPQRWPALPENARFCIGETGFGTALNFLCAWQLWDELAPAHAHMHFVSSEKYPLTPDDMQRSLALWPELQPWADQLLAQYGDLAPGWQQFSLANGRITLTLLIGDLLDTLPQLDASVDAWFLDGFAPSKNPDMWQPALYQQMARLSSSNATVATFTSVGDVRRGLQAAGFTMSKVKGFGRKREMLAGLMEAIPDREWSAPWYRRPAAPANNERTALVIGSGLAGCSTAFALARRGWQVTVIERHATPAAEASGNAQGIIYCKLSPHQTLLSRFVQTSYAYCLRLLHEILAQSDSTWAACGVLQLSTDQKEHQRQQALAEHPYPHSFLHSVSAEQASEIAGLDILRPGLFFPSAGWVNPPSLCQALLQHPNIRLQTNREALQLEQRDDQWHALDDQGQSLANAAVAVICSAADSRRFHQSNHLPLKSIRGQITHLPATAQSQQLQTVLCAEGYISPARDGEHHLGASFRFDRLDNQPSAEENIENLQLLNKLSPALNDALQPNIHDPAALAARASLRCTSPDYLPLIGPLTDAQAFAVDYAVLGKDASKKPQAPATWYPGLYINAAHGSRGLISCPLSGELIAAWIGNEPLPLPRDVAEAVHPSRFLLRQLIRGQ